MKTPVTKVPNTKSFLCYAFVRGLENEFSTFIQFIEKAIDVEGDMLKSVSSISCNNDEKLGAIIAEAYDKVGKQGVVLMEESESDETYVTIQQNNQQQVATKIKECCRTND